MFFILSRWPKVRKKIKVSRNRVVKRLDQPPKSKPLTEDEVRRRLAMGAEAVSMGTRFMATREAPIHESLKHRLVEATELDTQLIFRRFRNTARVFKNSVAEKVAEIESRRGAEFVDVAELVAGEKGAAVLESGDLELGIFWAGLSSGLVYDVPTVAELVSRIIVEAEEIINLRLRSLSQPSTAE